MNQINPKNIRMINNLPPLAKVGDKVSIDSEFFGQTKSRLHRPHGTFAFLGCSFDGKTCYYITDENKIQEFFDRIKEAVWIGQNLKYDFIQLRKYANIPDRSLMWDTMLIEQIMYSGYYNDFSLQDLARRYLDIYMPKDVRKTFSERESTLLDELGYDTVSMTKEQLDYACTDVCVTWMVYKAQRSVIDSGDLQVWKEIELPFLWTLLSMGGMKVDVPAWIALYERNYNDAILMQKKYMENPEILDEMSLKDVIKKKKLKGISLGSSSQVGKEITRLGYKLPKTKTGKDSTQEDNIAPLADECEFVRDVLEFRGKMKACGTYGMNWIEDGLIESDGCVYSNFKQMGAATGRLSSELPNVENIPVRETPDFRKCFVADEDWVLVDADWSAQEPRIFAYQTQDEQLIQIFKDKKDVYIESARLMFGWILDKKDPRRKERMKPTVLGASYGLTEYGMEKKYNIPKEEGRELLGAFFNTFVGAKEYKKKQSQQREYVQTIYGRKYWLNVYQKGFENNSLNSPTQGSAADAMKIAGAEFMDRVKDAGHLGFVFIINYVHDEILLKCKKDLLKWTTETLREVMIEVAENMHEGIPADVEISHGLTWDEAH